MTLNLPLRYKNASLGSDLVNMSAIFSFEWTYSNLISLSCTNSLTKWYFMEMCFVLECITRFFEILIALVLSQNMTIGSLISTFMPSSNCLNQTIFEQFTTTATYSASAIDWDVQFCFYWSMTLVFCQERMHLHFYFFFHQCFLPNLHQ